ncbi:sugar transporter-like protein [Lineolata rhizophorae]|uniref:Sugar transporter-like protein n=1 Tax=Lineolata rhizophorae TaxID=578093 RepID=A0A6A6P4A1_9PEZI|nr:sugar transporter-like protein [Lineolata rhizophorae]
MVVQGERLYHQGLVAGGFAFVSFGWDAGVLGGVLLTPEFQESMGYPDTTTVSMITSVFLLASWLGCIIISLFGMKLGRRVWIIIGAVLQILGSIICVASYGYGQLIAGRVVIGVGNGFCTSMVPVYVAEMAVRKERRGQGVNLMIAMATVGVAIAYWVDFGMVFAHGTTAVWRFPVAFQIVWSLLCIATFWPMPDTARWHYATGNTEEGDRILQRMYNAALTDNAVETSKKDILASLELEKTATAKLRVKDFFYDTSDLQAARRIRTGVLLVAIAYLMGINVIFYYTTVIFQSYIGLKALTASGLSGALNTVLVVANMLGVIFMEKFKRRTWLLAGSAGQSVFMAVFVGLLSTPGPKTGAAAAAMLFCWVVFFGPTWGPVTYVYSSDIMPLRYRHIGFSLSVSAQWLMAFVTVFAGPIAIADTNVGWKTWIWFLVFNVIAFPYVYFCCPETRGRTLEEIDLIFMSDNIRGTAAAKQLEHQYSSDPSTENVDSLQEKGAVATETKAEEKEAA